MNADGNCSFMGSARIQRRRKQRGAALPMVLVSIGLLALLTSASFVFLSRATDQMAALQERSAAEESIASAQAEALFTFLTAQPTTRGLNLAGEIDPNSGEAPADDEAAEAGAIWLGDGGWRRAATEPLAAVSYRDGAGLLALASASPAVIAPFLVNIGIEKDEAADLAARLSDFQDADFIRQFRGAERSDYRLHKRAPPTDAPLRTAEELGAVLGFETLSPTIRARIAENTAFPLVASPLKAAFAAQAVAPLIETIEAADPLFVQGSGDLYPSALARFTVAAPAGNTLLFSIVDIERTASGIDAPYRRMAIDRRAVPLYGSESDRYGMEIAAVRLYQVDGRAPRKASAYELAPLSAAWNPETEQ